jgi:SpoVK/Ycf46/Vps4 family AAA+-type ATPase
MREAFAEATSQAASGKPAIIFIDEIDTLCPRRDSRSVIPKISGHVKSIEFCTTVYDMFAETLTFVNAN